MGNMFLKIKSIPGSSKIQGMENAIEIYNFSWGASLNGVDSATKGETVGHPSLTDLSISKAVDKASPLLFANMTGGKRLTDDVELFVQKTLDQKSVTYYHVKLKGAVVNAYSASGAGGDAPMESVSFNFQKIEFSHDEEDGGKMKGAVTKGWDIVTHTAS
ncbi:MAG: Hcp family type VI secretion system effector [Candidatus Acidiferrales bacterium]